MVCHAGTSVRGGFRINAQGHTFSPVESELGTHRNLLGAVWRVTQFAAAAKGCCCSRGRCPGVENKQRGRVGPRHSWPQLIRLGQST